MPKTTYDDFVFSTNTNTVYQVITKYPKNIGRFYSREDFDEILMRLPFEFYTSPININPSHGWNYGDILCNLVQAEPVVNSITIRPPNGRRIANIIWKDGIRENLPVSLLDRMNPDNLMADIDLGGFRCCFHPRYKLFLSERHGEESTDLEDRIEIDILKYSIKDSDKIHEFIETLTPQKDDDYWALRRTEVELEKLYLTKK